MDQRTAIEAARARHHAASSLYERLICLTCDTVDFTQVVPDTEARLALLALREAGKHLSHAVERLHAEINTKRKK